MTAVWWDDPELDEIEDEEFEWGEDEDADLHAPWCAIRFGHAVCDCETTEDACPECGEVGPCAYDPQGLPLIHAGRR